MKHVGNAYGQVTSLLRDYLRPLGMLCEAGPLRVVRELTTGIVFTGSVQLTNAARLFCTTANQLSGAIERMGHHLEDESWDHRDWAGAVLHQHAGFVEEDDLIPIDGTELAKPYARGNAVTLEVSLPPEQVPQYGTPPKLFLIVPTYTFRRNGKPDRWLLLTCGLIGHRTGPRQVRYDYALRWRAEDAKRFLGQVCRVERFMVRSFTAIERTLWCATLAGGFLSSLQRDEPELSDQLQTEVLYQNTHVVLPVYRLARGLHALAGRHGPSVLTVNA